VHSSTRPANGLKFPFQDNPNIHTKASLYETFSAAEAGRLVERFEWHYTTKRGSWLDLAVSELGITSSQCLDRSSQTNSSIKSVSGAKRNWAAKQNLAYRLFGMVLII
jgi:hypothetical protein